jgi:tRNA pseudouridine38-40 synthase
VTQTPNVAGDASTTRLRLDLAYDGTDFSGWADQPGRRTVQGTLEAAIATVCRLPHARLTVAGRTDAGVHARGQVAHVDLPVDVVAGLAAHGLARRLARILPEDVRVRAVTVAPMGFDARFSAIWRRYAYRICDDAAAADPLTRRHVLTWSRPLDETLMNAAAGQLLGEHDFAAFCKKRAGATTIRTLHESSWTRESDVLTGRVVADAFCHNMVRSLVGCLISVGEERQPVEWPAALLRGTVRDPRVRVVAPVGLTLEEVGYPSDADLAARASESRRLRVPADRVGRDRGAGSRQVRPPGAR